LTWNTEVIVGEASALYDELLLSREIFVAADAVVARVACVDMDELVSLRIGGGVEGRGAPRGEPTWAPT
jgi:hypothetical protein